MLAALLWDVDGTVAETERDGHLVAFKREDDLQLLRRIVDGLDGLDQGCDGACFTIERDHDRIER